MTTVASSDFFKVGYVVESTRGTTPTSPAIQELRKTGATINPNQKNTESGEIVGGGRLRDIIALGQEPSLALPIELSGDSYTDQLAHALRGAWVTTPAKLGSTALASVAVSGVFTVASGGAAFIVGHLVKSSGWATAANNGVAPVTASTSTTVTLAALATAVETAPSTARIKVIGIKAANNGDVNASTSGGNHLTVTGINPTTAGIVPGLWLQLSGFTGTTANNDWVRAGAITGSGPWTIALDVVPTGFATDAAAGQKVSVFFNDYVRDSASVPTTSTYELRATDVGLYSLVKGGGVSGLSLDFAPNAIATGSFDLMALTATPWSAVRVSGATDLAVSTTAVQNTATHIGRIGEGGSALGATLVTRTGIKVTNELRRLPAVGSTGTADFQLGQFRVEFPLSVYLDATVTPGISAKLVAASASSFDLRSVDSAGYGYLADSPLGKYRDGGNMSVARNQTYTMPFTYSALETTPASGAAYKIHLQRVEPNS